MKHIINGILSIIFVILAITESINAAVGHADFSNPSYPGKCVIDSNTIMSPGQTGKAPNSPCAGVTCMEGGRAEFRTCPAVAPPRGCKLRDFVNVNRAYPECCERHYDCNKHI